MEVSLRLRCRWEAGRQRGLGMGRRRGPALTRCWASQSVGLGAADFDTAPHLPLPATAYTRCCACPVTKSARDDCFIKFNSDEAAIKCADLIDQHKACMRGYGFKV